MSSASNSGETTSGPATSRTCWLILASLVGASLLILGTLSLAVYTGQASAEEKKNDCGGLSLPLETPGSAQEQRDLQVAECMRQGKRAQAKALITEVIKSNPTDAEAYMNRGSVQTSLGEVELATAIRLDPNLASAWYNRGTTLAHVGRYESAIADFTEAMRLQPDFPLAYCNRGLAKTELGRYDEALADYTKAIEQDPNSTNCYFSRGTLYLAMGEYQKAIDDFSRQLEFRTDAMTYSRRGEAYEALGELQKALSIFKRQSNSIPSLKVQEKVWRG